MTASDQKQGGEDNKPPNPNPQHPGNPKTAEQLKKEQEAQAKTDQQRQEQQKQTDQQRSNPSQR